MPRKAAKRSARVGASVPPKLRNELKKIADQADISESRLIQEAITRFIDDYKAGNVALFSAKK